MLLFQWETNFKEDCSSPVLVVFTGVHQIHIIIHDSVICLWFYEAVLNLQINS